MGLPRFRKKFLPVCLCAGSVSFWLMLCGIGSRFVESARTLWNRRKQREFNTVGSRRLLGMGQTGTSCTLRSPQISNHAQDLCKQDPRVSKENIEADSRCCWSWHKFVVGEQKMKCLSCSKAMTKDAWEEKQRCFCGSTNVVRGIALSANNVVTDISTKINFRL